MTRRLQWFRNAAIRQTSLISKQGGMLLEKVDDLSNIVKKPACF